jgi:hypothetical protein
VLNELNMPLWRCIGSWGIAPRILSIGMHSGRSFKSLRYVTSLKTELFIIAAVRTSNPTKQSASQRFTLFPTYPYQNDKRAPYGNLQGWEICCRVSRCCRVASCLTLPTCIPDVSRSNLGRNNNYCDWSFSWFSSLPHTCAGIVPKIRPRPISPTSLQIHHSPIVCLTQRRDLSLEHGSRGNVISLWRCLIKKSKHIVRITKWVVKIKCSTQLHLMVAILFTWERLLCISY